tara:strand:- start:34 stop:189 length:156 start_codon:yes stop_codon:yes gene_type:complete
MTEQNKEALLVAVSLRRKIWDIWNFEIIEGEEELMKSMVDDLNFIMNTLQK